MNSNTFQIGLGLFFLAIVGGAFILPSGKDAAPITTPIITEYIPAIPSGEEDPIAPEVVVEKTIKEVQKKRAVRAAQTPKPQSSPMCIFDIFLLPFKALNL